MVTGVKIATRRPFKRPTCPKCGVKLDIRYKNQVVNSSSSQANNFDFSTGGRTFLVGDVEFITNYYMCPKCDQKFTVDEALGLLEKERRLKHNTIKNKLCTHVKDLFNKWFK